MTAKDIKTLLDFHMGDLDHFIDQSGYPIVTEEPGRLVKLCPWLHINERDLVARKPKSQIPAELLAAYWKKRYDEVNEDYNKIANAVEELHRKL